MCLLGFSKRGDQITRQSLRIGFENNGDGAGFAYAKDGELIVKKGFFSFNSFYEAYKESIGYPTIVHFRAASQGVVNAENCHPYSINNNLCIAHNGCIFNPKFKDIEKSDTRMLTENILTPIFNICPDLIKSNYFEKLFCSVIHTGKFIFLDNKDNYLIIGEDLGHWNNDIWWSNYSYEESMFGWIKGKTKNLFGLNAHNNFMEGKKLMRNQLMDSDEYYNQFMT